MKEIIWRDVLTDPPELEFKGLNFKSSKILLFLERDEFLRMGYYETKRGINKFSIYFNEDFEVFDDDLVNFKWLDIDFLKQFNKQ